jgi:hypothetical protein
MYELGMRHTRNLLTIQIGEYGRLPFDVNAIRTIQFSRSESGLIDARRMLEQALAVGLAEGGDPVAATRVWDDARGAKRSLGMSFTDGVVEAIAAHDDDSERDTLELIAAIEQVFPRMNDQMERVGEILVELGTMAVASEEEFNALMDAGASATKRLTVIRAFASQLEPRAEELASLTSAFVADMESADRNVLGVLAHLSKNPNEIGTSVEFLNVLVDLAESAREAMDELGTFGTAAAGLGQTSRLLRPAASKMTTAVNTIAKAAAKMDDWQALSSALLEEYMAE